MSRIRDREDNLLIKLAFARFMHDSELMRRRHASDGVGDDGRSNHVGTSC